MSERVAACAAALALLLAASPAWAQDWRTVTSQRAASGETSLRVDVEYGAGQLKLGPASAGVLYRTNIRYDADVFRPKVDFSENRLRVGIEGAGNNARGRNMRESLLDVKVSPDVPIDLRVAFGAAEASLDLGGIRLRRARIQTGASRTSLNVTSANREQCEELEIEVGAAKFEANQLGNLNLRRLRVKGGVGEVTLDFTGSWERNLDATIEMGLGSLILRLPRGLGVQIVKEGMLASFDSQELIKRGNTFYSQNWESAAQRLTIDVKAALGAIRVEWVD